MSEVIPALEEVAMARVIARQAIRDVLSRYCRGLDRMDKAMAYSVFHADASACPMMRASRPKSWSGGAILIAGNVSMASG
jgi:hypothetical protein